jgi:hypothetical protein
MRVYNPDNLDPISPAAFGMGAHLQSAVGGAGHGAGGSARAAGSPRSAETVFRGTRARGRGAANVHGAALRVVRGVPELFGPGGGASGNGPSIGFPAHL